jgi:hypothetical protein
MKCEVALILALWGTTACGGAPQTPNTSVNPVQEQAAGSRMQDDTIGVNLVPPGYGTLRQDDVSIKIQYEGIQVKLIPLDESVIRTLSPDSYRALRDLLESRQGQINTIMTRRGVRQQRVWYVSFYGLEPEARFSPMEVTITNSGRDYRPLEIIPLSAGFGSQRLRQRETQAALYLFEEDINVEQPITVAMGGVQNNSWDTTLRQIQRERALIRSRSSRAPTTP